MSGNTENLATGANNLATGANNLATGANNLAAGANDNGATDNLAIGTNNIVIGTNNPSGTPEATCNYPTPPKKCHYRPQTHGLTFCGEQDCVNSQARFVDPPMTDKWREAQTRFICERNRLAFRVEDELAALHRVGVGKSAAAAKKAFAATDNNTKDPVKTDEETSETTSNNSINGVVEEMASQSETMSEEKSHAAT